MTDPTTGQALHWREAIDLAAHRALVEIRQRAESARRTLGQRIRWARVAVRRVVA
jgi:hypothetical protein